MRRYDIVLEKDGQKVKNCYLFQNVAGTHQFLCFSFFDQLETREGFLRKPLGCKIGIKRRDL